jgi:hypothetical protein
MKHAIAASLLLIGCLIPVQADVVNIGALSYDEFIPADGDLPGVNAFNILNLTGLLNSIPPDFPVGDDLVFQNATLTLTYAGGPVVTNLGDVFPGLLTDLSFQPVVQVPSTDVIISAEFDATLSPLSFLLDGNPVTATSASILAVLMPSSGDSLAAGDAALIATDVEAVALPESTVPEPRAAWLLLLGMVACGYVHRRNRNQGKKSDA